MKLNHAGYDLIMSHEGLKLQAYLCPAGKPTIGYGHTESVTMKHVREGRRITEHEAQAILSYDIDNAEEIVRKHVTRQLNENQFAALVSFVFNLGPGKEGVKDGFVTLKNGKPSSLLRHVNAGQFHSAAKEFAKWTTGVAPNGQRKEFPGLVKRRESERKLFLEPVNQA